MNIFGDCDARFSAVRDAFRENFAQRDELGASVAVWLDGRLVVDLWGGWLEAERERPWPRDGIVNVWSVGKAMTALAVLKLIDAGELDIDRPVASYWPEFAQAGKDDVTVAQLLSHQAGLPGLSATLPLDAYFHWPIMAEALAAQSPWWPPGSAHGYHTNTFSFLNGEVLRRVTGSRLRDFFEMKWPLSWESIF